MKVIRYKELAIIDLYVMAHLKLIGYNGTLAVLYVMAHLKCISYNGTLAKCFVGLYANAMAQLKIICQRKLKLAVTAQLDITNYSELW